MEDPLVLDYEEVEQVLLANLAVKVPLTDPQVALVNETIKELGCSVVSALSRLAFCNEEILASELASILNWQLVAKVSECPDVSKVMAQAQAQDISLDWCIEQNVFLSASVSDEQVLHVYTNEPNNSFAFSVIQANSEGADIVYHLLSSAMKASLVDDLLRERAVNELFSHSSVSIAALAEEAPVINLVNSFMEKAIQAESSDVHIEAGSKNMYVRFRVDGTLIEYMQQPMSRFPAIASRIKLMAQLDIAERRLPQDGRFSTRSGLQEFDVRVSTAPDVHGESIVMRLLPKKREELSLNNLGFEPDHLAIIKRWGALSNGIVLVTGPTGSGKSTTLYGLLSDIRTGREKIVTVEDPVEFQLEGITQVQAKPEIGYTFAKALRTFLRQDPDVIMVGEIRDKETADIAIQSSLTGHLVLSTLHTNDACSVFPRLGDIGVEPFLTAATIQGVQAQRLVRKLCVHCCEKALAPSFLEKGDFGKKWRKAVGCKQCQGRGYKGRIGIYELIEVSAKLRELITQGASVAELRKRAKKDGARNLLSDGLLKASHGITSVEEVLRVCNTEDGEK